MRLVCALTDAGGTYNEDAFGFVESNGTVTAAWVIDGVTGINEHNILPAATDALWFVERVQVHLHQLTATPMALPEVLERLVNTLVAEWTEISRQLNVPVTYDLPACCLLLVRKYDHGWEAVRLGDSFLLTSSEGRLLHHAIPPSNLDELDREQKAEARRQRAAGIHDFKALLAEFRPRMLANRLSRNKPGGVSVLEPTRMSLAIAQFMELGNPTDILLCTDGFYRSVDHYKLYDDQSLMDACGNQHQAQTVLQAMREVEAADMDCNRFLRFKPQDDATVLKLTV